MEVESPTRAALLDVKNKIKLASRGMSLLKKKRDVLVNRMIESVKGYREFRQEVLKKTKDVYKTLSYDIAYTGAFISGSVSYATPELFEMNLEHDNIMGVKIPVMSLKEKGSDMKLEQSPILAQSGREFRDLFKMIVRLAQYEWEIKSLSDEIIKTKRRVNSLENITIPRLEELKKSIAFSLDEQERESFTRLSYIKKQQQND